MNQDTKANRYQRIAEQLRELFVKTTNPSSRMATTVALLHHKMPNFYWTGFYMLHNGELLVDVYQGPIACLLLKKDVGVCWASINRNQTIVVEDVHQFEGHIACSSATNSEIVVPLRNKSGEVLGVLDIDSKKFANFDSTDATELEKINQLIYE